MACDICGRQMKFFEGNSVGTMPSITICNECKELWDKSEKGDSDAYTVLLENVKNRDTTSQQIFQVLMPVPEDIRRKNDEEYLEKKRQREAYEKHMAEVKNTFMTTSGFNFEGYKITEYLGFKSGEIVMGTGIFAELESAVTDFIGAASDVMANKLTKAKNMAINILVDSCIKAGGNAAIGIDIDIMTVGHNQLVVSANGTAVKIEKLIE